MSKTKSLLIVGGTGFIGKYLVRTSMQKNYKTTVLSLNKVDSSNHIEGVEYVFADVANYEILKQRLINNSYNYVVNLGGYINHAKYKDGGRKIFDAHFIGVQNLITLLDWSSLESFVQIGSSDEYGDTPAPQSESNHEQPISPYSSGKVAATMLLQMLHRTEKFPAVILRLFLVYGPGQNQQRFLPQIIKGCINDDSFDTTEGQQLRDFCYIDDVVNGILLALENPDARGEIINIASGEPVKIRSVTEEVIQIIGKGTAQYGTVPYRDGENKALYADVDKAEKILGWRSSVNLSSGLQKTIDYYQNLDLK